MRLCFLLLLLIILPLSVYAQTTRVEINITESGKITSYYDEYWVVNVQGTIKVHNPFNNSFDFLKIKLDLGTMTIISDNYSDILKQDQIYIPFIEAHETISANYEIKGISAYDPMEDNRTVLRTAIGNEKALLYTFMISNIKKSEIENQTISTGNVRSKEKRRLVSVTLENPSDLNQNISSIRVIKTPAQDPNNAIQTWYFPTNGSSLVIGPHEIWNEDVVDYNSTEGEVYWLSTDAITDTAPLLLSDHLIYRFTQEDLFNVENVTLEELEYLENITDYLEHLMYLKKSVSDTVLTPGEVLTVSVKVNNFAPISRIINLTDSIPSGFRLLSQDANRTSDNTLFWTEKINPDNARIFKYDLEFYDNDTIGLDYFEAAKLDYENETLYSERIPFIRQFIPDRKIFIQKKLRYSISDEIVVQIQIQNLGEATIEDLYVREFLAANDVFREISQAPEGKGRWRIPILKRGEIWEVTYVTNENKAVNLLPEVFGVDKSVVLKTLVFENTVRNSWISPAMKTIEIAAPIFILGFIIFFFVYRRRVYTGKVVRFKSLNKIIRKLKKDTDLKPRESINLLKRESKTKKEIPSVGAPHYNAQTKSGVRNVARDNISKLKRIEDETK